MLSGAGCAHLFPTLKSVTSFGILKLALVGIFTSWKMVYAAIRAGLYPAAPHRLLTIYNTPPAVRHLGSLWIGPPHRTAG